MLIRKKNGGLVEVRSQSTARDTAPWPNQASAGERRVAPSPSAPLLSPSIDLSRHVICSDGRHLLLADPTAERSSDRSDSLPTTDLVFTRITEYHDWAFVPLPGPCVRCGGREFWLPRRTPQQRKAEIGRYGGGVAGIGQVVRLARVVPRINCAACERPRLAALVQGELRAVPVQPGDVMENKSIGGWIWESEVEDFLLSGQSRANTEANTERTGANEANKANPWWNWPLYDAAMGLRVVE